MSLSMRPHLNLDSKEEQADRLFKEEQEIKMSQSRPISKSNRYKSSDDNSFFSQQFINTIQDRLGEIKQSLQKLFGVFFNPKTKINHDLYRDYKKVDAKVTTITGFVDQTSIPSASIYAWNRLTGRLGNVETKQTLKDVTSVELESLGLRIRAAEIKIAAQHDYSNTIFRGFGLLFYPKSYFKMKNVNKDPIEQAIKLFSDYSTNQYIRGHFNRHHTETANIVIAKLKEIQLSGTTLEKQVNEAQKFISKMKSDFIVTGVLVNDKKLLDKSSFFRRLNFALDRMLVMPVIVEQPVAHPVI